MKLKRIFAILLTLCMLFTQEQTMVMATESTEATAEEVSHETDETDTPGIPDGVVLNYRDVELELEYDTSFADESVDGIPANKATLPASYSSASNIPDTVSVDEKGNYVTSVKNQGIYGTCWAHSAISVAESSYIIDQNATVSTLNPDWNEYHLAYYFWNTPDDPLGLLGGDYVNNTTSYNDLDVGGNSVFTIYAYANWIGASDSTTFTAADALNGTYKDNTEVAYDAAAHMQNGYMLSMPNMGISNYTADMNVIKSMIMEYGSVAMSYCAAHSGSFWNGEYQYCDVAYVTNHAVTIVGWNDNIPASAFATTPPGDGAWLVKNSWGEDWGLGGYFWLSYYDETIDERAFVFDFTDADIYDNNYQYDGGVYPGTYSYYDQACAANVFVADSAETVKAVGFYTWDVNTDYEIRIYRNLGDEDLPNEGELVLTQTGSETYAGYHTVELDYDVKINREERYAIVVTLKKPDSMVHMAVDKTFQNGDWLYTYSSAKAGESYIGTSVDSLEDFNNGNADYGNGINVRIKSFTDERDTSNEVKVTNITLDISTAKLPIRETLKINATVSPSNATNAAVKWKSSDPSIAKVDSDGNVTGIAAGTVTITATAKDGNGASASCEITVHTVPVSRITLNETSLHLFNYNTYQMTATVAPHNATNAKVTWSTSDSSVAQIDENGKITAFNTGTAIIKATATDGSGVSASCKVTVTPILVTDIILNATEITLEVGETFQLEATVLPRDAADQTLRWSTSDYTVSLIYGNGIITAEKVGTAMITVSAMDLGGVTASCKVTVVEKKINGWHQDAKGDWYYYKDGKVDTSVNGVVPKDKEYWYAVKGKADFTYFGVAPNASGSLYYVKNGKVNFNINGLVRCGSSKDWYYFKNGKVQNVTTIVKNSSNGNWYYIKGGKVQFDYTGVAQKSSGVWYYCKAGKVDFTFNGVAPNAKGALYYVNKGKVDFEKNGIHKRAGVYYYFKNGKVQEKDTIIKHTNGNWYAVWNGVVDLSYDGVASNDKGTYYIENGKVDFSKAGILKRGTKWYYFKKGKVQEIDTIAKNASNGNWYAVWDGIVDLKFEGIASNEKGMYYCQKGKVNFNFTGTVEYEGHTYKVVKGKATLIR